MPELHPKLQAALDRDAVALGKLAQVVGLDARTVARWGSDDEYGSRAAAFRRLEDFIAGRSRAVEAEPGTWALEELGEGVPRADVVALLMRLKTVRAEVDEAVKALSTYSTGEPLVLREDVKKSTESALGDLRPLSLPVYRGDMNAIALQSVAAQVRARSRGKLVPYIQKVPPDFRPRLRAAAAKVGLSESDYLRALIELHTEPEGE